MALLLAVLIFVTGLALSSDGAGGAFVSWADGEKIVVKRNEKYWKPNRNWTGLNCPR